MNLDILLVTDTAASVQISAMWNADVPPSHWAMFNTFWNQVISTDQVQSWRESISPADLFFKFAIASIPPLVTWYYLSSEFLEYISNSQILFLSILIQLTSVLLFLSIGAWLPMAGCIICVLAVNYDVNTKTYWQGYVRPSLLFLTAVCNSIQFAWLLALVGEAGWDAFYYQITLDQLYSLSYQFIITNESSPTWVALMLPNVLLVNISLLIGSAICVVLEGISFRKN